MKRTANRPVERKLPAKKPRARRGGAPTSVRVVDARPELRRRLLAIGPIETITPQSGIDAFVAFFREVRVEGKSVQNRSDALSPPTAVEFRVDRF